MTENRAKGEERAPRIAVTGGAASGKSTVCRHLGELGAFVVDLDRLAREAVAPGSAGLERVYERFGSEVVTPEGRLNRGRLREIIVGDPEARRDLESIVHPEVLHRMQRMMDDAESVGAKLLVAEVPLLFEAGLENAFDRLIVVAAPEPVRVRRIVNRDSVDPGQAEALIGVQMPEEEKKRRADIVIENDGTLQELLTKVDHLYERLIGGSEKGGESA